MNELDAYSDDQKRGVHPFARPPTPSPVPQFVLGELTQEVGAGVYKWKRRIQDSGHAHPRGPLGGKATEVNLATGLSTSPPNNKIIVFADAGRWWFDNGLSSSSGSGLSFVDFSHTFTGSENYEADGANQSQIYIGAVPITGEFFLWGCTVKITTSLVGGATVDGAVFPPGVPNLPWKTSHLRVGGANTGTSTPASPIYMTDPPTFAIATGFGDSVTFSGVTAGSFINGRGLENLNQVIRNGYAGGIPDSLGSSKQRHLWFALEDSSFNHADQIASGAIHGRIWFFQTPTTPSDL